MLVFGCNQPTFFDVDGTLVKWRLSKKDWEGDKVIKVPWLGESGETHYDYIAPHAVHIEQLKLHHMRGHTIIVWSAGGTVWGKKVVELLGLQDYVHLVIEKPMWAYDDLQPGEFFKTIWMKDEVKEE